MVTSSIVVVLAAVAACADPSQASHQVVPGTPSIKLVPATPLQGAIKATTSTVQFAPVDAAAAIAAMRADVAAEIGEGLPIDDSALTPAGPLLSPEQLDDLRRLYNASPEAERAQLRAYFADMCVDIRALLGGPGAPTAGGAASLAQAVRSVEFTRTPQSVLAARSKIGFGDNPKPHPRDHEAMAKWLQLQVLAGEWSALAEALRGLPSADAVAAYTQILQTINRSQRGGDPNQRPDPGLLPEEVLAIADASPEPLSDWQVAIFAQLLKDAATRYSTAQFLARLMEGTEMFGAQDAARRERTVKLLLSAELPLEASRFFPPLDEARAQLDALALFNYGRYYEELAASPQGSADAERHLRTAWSLFGEAALVGSAETALRQDAIRRSIDLLPQMPPTQSGEWLKQIFATPALAPAALEILALKAVALDSAALDAAARARTILTMKEAVDTLLRQTTIDREALRVPLRMLTTALMGEADGALSGNPRGRRPGMDGQGGSASPQQLALLMRAMPDDQWMAELEPSLASRAYRTTIALATAAQEVDVALDALQAAVARFPDQATALADEFLGQWTKQLGSSAIGSEDYAFIGFVRGDMGGAPLTRGKQRRNLAHLARLIMVLEDIGIDAQRLPAIATAFAACHGRTEVFTREGIVKVFGPIAELEPATAARLADQMRSKLSGEWRDRRAQQAAGMKRTPKEIVALVEAGYTLALELIDHAIAARPHSWNDAVIKAGLAIDRVQYKQEHDAQDFAVYNQYRKAAFDAFAQTAARYAELVASGDQRDDPAVYLAWFGAAVGSTELNYLTREDLLVEGSPQDDQIDLIRKSIASMSPDAASRHIDAFARSLSDSISALAPEVKPRVIRHAMRIIGKHPSGASMARLLELHQDLMKDEVKLRLAIDGDDRVGSGRQFGVTLSLRFTAEVDRETGGFSRYLMNDVWARVGNSYKAMNYRDLLRKQVESGFGEHFAVEGIGFFEALAPPTTIREGGEAGWLEKPLAYIVLVAKDPSVDRVPPVSIDMHFNDQAGPVVLAVASNSPQIDAAHETPIRPIRALDVVETVDLREIDGETRSGERKVVLEVSAKGEGVVPSLETLLPGFRQALDGFEVAATGIEERPFVVVEAEGIASQMRMNMYGRQPDDKEYIKPDASGVYRLATERTWTITYTPTGAGIGDSFRFPQLSAEVIAASLPGGTAEQSTPATTLTAREYADMDVVTVTALTTPVRASLATGRNIAISTAVVMAIAGALTASVALTRRRRAADAARALGVSSGPVRLTPLSVVTALRAVRAERANDGQLTETDRAALTHDIESLEAAYFGPDEHKNGTHDLRAVTNRWIGAKG